MSTGTLAIEIGDAEPKDLAARFFGRSRIVTPTLELCEKPGGFVVSHQGIPMRVIVFFLLAFSLLIGVVVWNVSKDFAAFLSSFAVVGVAATALLYTCDDPAKEPGVGVTYDKASRVVTVDSVEQFEAGQLECLYDARGWDQRKSSGFRQVSALVRRGDRRYLYRLFHQCAEDYAEDELADTLAARFNVPCHVLEDVVFEGI